MKNVKAKDLYQYIISKLKTTYEDIHECKSVCNIIFRHLTKCNLVDLLLNVQIKFEDYNTLDEICYRLQRHEPIQYVFNTATFYNIDLYVDENVFIPRHETEEMVYDIINNISLHGKTILDLCTGSGCIPIVIKKKYHDTNVYAIDISSKALYIAQINAKENNVEVTFLCKDIFDDSIFSLFKNKSFDIIISNPPYVCESEKKYIEKRILNYEPHNAIFVSDDDPIKFYKRIAILSERLLKKNGDIYLEINNKFKHEIKNIFEKYTCYNDIKDCYMYSSNFLHFRQDTKKTL